jgi:hypothetical protein
MKIIHQIAKNNGYPNNIIEKLNKQIKNKIENKSHNSSQTKKLALFEYHNPIIRKITNIFKNTDIQIAYEVKNTTQHILKEYGPNWTHTKIAIYSLKCNKCNMQYVGQTGCNLKTRYIEHCRHIKSSDPKSAFAMHILNNKYEYGPINTTITLVKTFKKGWYINILENWYIQQLHQSGILIKVQQPAKQNLLFKIIKPTTSLTHMQNPTPTDTT